MASQDYFEAYLVRQLQDLEKRLVDEYRRQAERQLEVEGDTLAGELGQLEAEAVKAIHFIPEPPIVPEPSDSGSAQISPVLRLPTGPPALLDADADAEAQDLEEPSEFISLGKKRGEPTKAFSILRAESITEADEDSRTTRLPGAVPPKSSLKASVLTPAEERNGENPERASTRILAFDTDKDEGHCNGTSDRAKVRIGGDDEDEEDEDDDENETDEPPPSSPPKMSPRKSVSLKMVETFDYEDECAPRSNDSFKEKFAFAAKKESKADLHSEEFKLLEVWSSAGGRNVRSRAFSVRSKSQFLTDGKPEGFAGGLEAADNPLGLEAEAAAPETEPRPFVVHPSAIQHLIWDMFGLILLAYDCVWIPLEVFDFEESGLRTGIAWIIRLYWTANMFKSFFTGYLLDDGQVEMRVIPITKRYAMTWLPVDIVVVGTDWFEAAVAGSSGGGYQRFGSGLRGLRMVRTVRLIRLIKAPEVTAFLNEQIRSEQILLLATILKVILIMLAVAHLIACLWYGLGRLNHKGSNWIDEYEMHKLAKSQQYVTSFHWSLSQFAGELVFPATNGAERVFLVFVLFFGIIISAWFVSSITTSMTQLQMMASQQSTQINMLRRYLVDQSISRPLAVRVQRNAQYALLEKKRNVAEDDVELLSLISNPLLVELHFEIHGHVLRLHPFFDHYHYVNPGGIRKVCHEAVHLMSVHTGDVLFSDMEVPKDKRMFIVVSGELTYHTETKATQTVSKGDWFCEGVIWTTWTHCGTCKATTETQLLVLEAKDLPGIISTFPTDHVAMYADEYIRMLNEYDDMQTDLACDPETMSEIIEMAFPSEDTSSDEDSDDSIDHKSSGIESTEIVQVGVIGKMLGKRVSHHGGDHNGNGKRHSHAKKRGSTNSRASGHGKGMFGGTGSKSLASFAGLGGKKKLNHADSSLETKSHRLSGFMHSCENMISKMVPFNNNDAKPHHKRQSQTQRQSRHREQVRSPSPGEETSVVPS